MASGCNRPTVVDGNRSRVPPAAGGVLERQVQLAHARSRAQRLRPLHDDDRWTKDPLHTPEIAPRVRDAAGDDPWLPGNDLGDAAVGSGTDRSDGARRR